MPRSGATRPAEGKPPSRPPTARCLPLPLGAGPDTRVRRGHRLLAQIFDEILVNAADNRQRDPSMSYIRITADRGTVSVENNGTTIPVQLHETEGATSARARAQLRPR